MVTNNSVGISSQGVTYYNGTGSFSGLDGSTAGFVLTSNGTGVAPSFQANTGGGAITTINGDSGSITGATVTIYANNIADGCGHTVLFDNSATTSTLKVSDALQNTSVGSGSGANITGANNTVFGSASLNNATTAGITGTTVVGAQAGQSIQHSAGSDGYFNTVIGYLAWSSALNPGVGDHNNIFGAGSGSALETGSYNTLIGAGVGATLTTGSVNTIVGAGDGVTTGSYNVMILGGGATYTGGESGNVLIHAQGVNGESNVIRIRDTTSLIGAASACYIGGIQGVSVSNREFVTIDTTTGQLGSSATLPQSTLSITSVNNAASPYTVLTTDEFLACQTSTGAITINLPNSTTTGRVIIIKDSNGAAATNNISITTPGGTVTIDGSTTYTINTNYFALSVVFDGTNYEVF